MALHLSPLHPLFAVRVEGLDLSRPPAAATVAAIEAAIERYAVLVLPDQRLDDGALRDLAEHFGPLEIGRTAARGGRRRIAIPQIGDISNLDADGRVRPRHDRQRIDGLGNRLWHTDASYMPVPVVLGLLYAVTLPAPSPFGAGETEFADLRAAYDALPDAVRAAIDPLVAIHDVFHSRGQLGLTEFPPGERERYPPSPQRLVRRLAGSGRKTLYLSAHASHVRGWPVADGRLLLGDLTAHATRPEFVYRHRWRTGDLVIWDNRCTMHRGRPHTKRGRAICAGRRPSVPARPSTRPLDLLPLPESGAAGARGTLEPGSASGRGWMKTRTLGAAKLEVSAVGLGCMVMPGFYNPGSEEEAIATLRRAGDIAMGFLDTSDAYGNGANEELIARAVAGRRDDFVIATKFGNIRTPDGKPAADGRPAYVMEACEASLRRLGIDVIDLYYQHRVDVSVPIEDTVGAMARLVEEGKVRHLGLSEAAPSTIRRAHAVHPITALQTEYSLWSRDAEADVLPLCRELGIGYVAYSPLGRGIFGGAISGPGSLPESDRRRSHPRFQGDNLARNLALLGPLRELAAARGCTLPQLALAWVLAQGEDIVPIPGTGRVDHLEANAAAAEIALGADELAALGAAFPPGSAAGARYPEAMMRMLHL